MGASKIGLPFLGEGDKDTQPKVPVAQEVSAPGWVLVDGRKRWSGALAATSLASVALPPTLPVSLDYLRGYYGGKQVDPELLIVCPHTDSPWNWLYYKSCQKCPGHTYCLVEFLTSPQMLEPTQEAVHV